MQQVIMMVWHYEPMAPEDIAKGPKRIWSTERTLDVICDFVGVCPGKEEQERFFIGLQAGKEVSCRSAGGDYPATFTRHAREVAGSIKRYMDANGGAVPSLASLADFRNGIASAKRRIFMQNIMKRMKHPFKAGQGRQRLNTLKA